MNWEQMFPGRFIKSAEFGGRDVTLTITEIKLEELPDDAGKAKKRGIMYFKETPKGLVLNRTNATALKHLWGPETDKWIGKHVCLYAAPFTDPFTGEHITAVRVRGSPDIHQPVEFEARIGRKQVRFKLSPTGKKNGNGKKAGAESEELGPGADG